MMYRGQRWENKIKEIEEDDKAFWSMARALRSNKTTIPPLQLETGIVYTDEDKANAFARAMQNKQNPR